MLWELEEKRRHFDFRSCCWETHWNHIHSHPEVSRLVMKCLEGSICSNKDIKITHHFCLHDLISSVHNLYNTLTDQSQYSDNSLAYLSVLLQHCLSSASDDIYL